MRLRVRPLTLAPVPGLVLAVALLAAPRASGDADGGGWKSVGDIPNARIGVLTGSVHDGYVRDHYPKATILRYGGVPDLVLSCQGGAVDAAMVDSSSAQEALLRSPDLGILEDGVFPLPYGFAFSKSNPALRGRFNAFLARLRSDGTYSKMRERWILGNAERAAMPEIGDGTGGGTLRAGVAPLGLPFVAKAGTRYVGFDVELLRRFAKDAGLKLEIQDFEFSGLIAALAAGKVDVLAASICITEERSRLVDFSAPYFSATSAFLAARRNLAAAPVSPAAEAKAREKAKETTKAAGTGGWKRVEEIPDPTIGVYVGTVYDDLVKSRYPKAKILRFTSTPDMVLSLEKGTLDAVVLDAVSAHVVLRSNPDVGILEANIFSFPYGIGFSKSDPALRERFNGFLAKIRADGTYEEMIGRWIRGNPETAEMPRIPAAPEGSRTLAVGVSVADLPYVAQVGTRYVGLDVELLERFAADAGMRLEMKNYDFSALVTALAARKVEMIADGIAITEERKRQVDFSDPYFTAETSVIAAKKNLAPHAEGAPAPTPKAAPSFGQRVAESFEANIVREQRYLLIVDGLKTTVVISLLSTFLGTLLGALVCFLRMSRWAAARALARAYIGALRGTPVLVLLMIIFYVVFASVAIDPVVVASIAFALNFAAYVSEMFRVGIEGVDRGQTEAGIALGFTKAGAFLAIVLPQAARSILPVFKGEFISLVKMTSIVGYIAVQDLTKASDIIRSRTFDAFFPLVLIAFLYFLVSWTLASGLTLLEIWVDPRSRRRRGAGR